MSRGNGAAKPQFPRILNIHQGLNAPPPPFPRSRRSVPARRAKLLTRRRRSYDGFVTYVVQHGTADHPSEEVVETVAAAARIAIGLVREQRRNVRVKLDSGAVLGFDAFQEAVFRGELKDAEAGA